MGQTRTRDGRPGWQGGRALDQARGWVFAAVCCAPLVVGCAPKRTPAALGESAGGSTAPPEPSGPTEAAQPPDEPAGAPHEEPHERPPPAALAAEVERAAKLGNVIYHHDQWAAVATDLALAKSKLRQDRTIKGWVVEERGQGAVVHFVRAGVTSALRIRFPGADTGGATLETTAEPLSPTLVTMAKARETAAASPFPRLARAYNPVVLPATSWGEPGFLVYLLAADERPGELAIGGHCRVHVSADGATATTFSPLSKTIVWVPFGREPSGPAGAQAIPFVTHFLTDAPTEAHVWTSLSARRELFVATKAGLWRVDGVKVAFLGNAPARPAPHP
jgi:hypothetical protein